MKKIAIFVAIGLAVFCSCSKEEIVNNSTKNTDLIASFEQAQTKTVMNGLSIEWVADDAIKVWDAAGKYAKYTANEAGSRVSFTQSATEKDAEFDSDVAGYAFYPYSAVGGYDNSTKTVTFTIPAEQTYAANSFGQNSNFAVAKISPINDVADDAKEVKFTNVGGVLELQLSVAEGQVANVGRIVLTDNANSICGTFTVDASADSPSAVYSADGGNSITLDCGDGVSLSDNAAHPTSFFITVPTGALNNGFTAEIYSNHDHLITTLTTEKNISVLRSVVNSMKNKEVEWLAAGLVEFDYLQSSSHQVINTQFHSTTGYKATASFEYTSFDCYNVSRTTNAFVSNINPMVLGIDVYDGTYKFFTLDCNNGVGSSPVRVCHGPSSLTFETCVIGKRYNADVDFVGHTSATINGTNKSNSKTYILPDVNIAIFGGLGPHSMQNSSVIGMSSIKLYFVRLYDSSNTLVRNYIPAYNPDGAALHRYGLYDVVTGEFYTNAVPDDIVGVEDFTAGNNEEH